MRTISFLSIIVVFLLLQACIIKSIHPFFKESDLIFKEELLSSWIDQDNNKWVIKRFEDTKNVYEMHQIIPGKKDVIFLTRLFMLDNQYYLDFYPLADTNHDENSTMFDLHLMPTHSIARVNKLTNNEIHIQWFNEDRLKKLFDENRIKISHEVISDEISHSSDDKTYILTASTDELQKFIIKYGNDDEAFKDSNATWLNLKKSR